MIFSFVSVTKQWYKIFHHRWQNYHDFISFSLVAGLIKKSFIHRGIYGEIFNLADIALQTCSDSSSFREASLKTILGMEDIETMKICFRKNLSYFRNIFHKIHLYFFSLFIFFNIFCSFKFYSILFNIFWSILYFIILHQIENIF